MRSRVFNRTGRLRIEHAEWPITMEEDGITVTVALPVDGAAWIEALGDAPEETEVHIDLLGSMLHERYTIGTLRLILESVEPALITLPVPLRDGKAFRVEIVVADRASGGLILARSEPRRFAGGVAGSGASSSDLHVVSGDLKDRVWELRLDNAGPTLVINDRITDWNAIARLDSFRMLVIGDVLEQIYRAIALEPNRYDWMDRFRDAPEMQACEDLPTREDYDDDESGFREVTDEWAKEVARIRCGRLGSAGSEVISAVDRFLSDIENREAHRA